jgi:hypothetical protein
MKIKTQAWLGFFGLGMITLACSLPTIAPITPTQVDQVGTIVAATMQALTASPGQSVSTSIPNQSGGIPFSYENISFVIPSGLTRAVNPEAVPAVAENSGAPWEVAPAHLKFSFVEYQLQGKFHEPAIYVYPADDYAKVNSNAGLQIESIKRIRAGSPILRETMPRIPWFNADLLIVANTKLIPFQNGRGVRTLTEYSQYDAPINNHELIYHFQGLTDDDKYYVFAILPITAPVLAEDEKPESPVPAGGIPIPTSVGQKDVYYFSVSEKLNSLSPDSFTPALNALDTLIQSILVKNP